MSNFHKSLYPCIEPFTERKGKKEKDASCNVVGKHNDTKSLLTLMAAATCESRLGSRV